MKIRGSTAADAFGHGKHLESTNLSDPALCAVPVIQINHECIGLTHFATFPVGKHHSHHRYGSNSKDLPDIATQINAFVL
jgi:hypothetical protein